MAVIGEAYVKITAQTAGFAKDVGEKVVGAVQSAGQKAASALSSALHGAIKGVGAAIKAIGETIATAFKIGVSAAAGFSAAVIKAGTSYNILGQKSMAAFKTLLGTTEAAEEMMASLAEFAKTSPFPRQAFIEGTQQLLGFGMEAERVIPTLDAIQQAVAATGGSAGDIQEIVHVLAQVEGTGKITANTLNMLGMRGINAAEIIGEQMGKTGNEIRDQITRGTLDAAEAVDALAAGMQERFGGATDALKETWEGATDRIKGAMRDIGSAIMEPFIGFTGGGAFVAFANTVADALRTIESDVIPALMPAIEGLADHIGTVGDAISGVFDGLGEGGVQKLLGMFEGMGPVIAGVGTALATAFSSGLPFIGQFLGGLNPIVMGLTALIATSEPLREAFMGAFEALGPAFGDIAGVVTEVAGTLGDALVPILGAVAGIFEGIAPSLSIFAGLLSDVAGTVGEALVSALETLMPSLGDFVVALVDGLVPFLPVVARLAEVLGDVLVVVAEVLADVFDALAPAIPPITEAIGLLVGALGDGLSEVLMALVPALPPLAEALTEILLAVMPLIPPLAELITLLVEKIGAPVLIVIAEAVAVLATALAEVAKFVAQILGAGIEKLADLIGGLAGALANLDFGEVIAWFGRLPGMIGNALGSLGGSLVKAFTGAFKALVKAIPKAGGAVLGWFAGLPGEIGKALKNLGSAFLDSFVDAFVGATTALPGLAADVLGFFVGLPFDILQALVTLGATLVDAFFAGVGWLVGQLPGVFAAVFAFVTSVPGQIVTALGALGSALVGVFTSAFTSVLSTVTSLTGKVISFLAGLPGKAVSAISSLVTTLPAKMGEAMASVLSTAQKGVANVASAIGQLPGKLLGHVAKIGSAALSIGSEIITKIGEGISAVGTFVGDVASSIWNGIKNFINENISDKIRNFRVRVPGPMGTSIYEGKPFGSFPRFARGGYIRAQSGGHLAVVGEGGYDEIVLSTNPAYQARNRALMERAGLHGGSGGGGIVFGPGAVVLQFNGATPSEDEARQIGQHVGEGVTQVLARNQVARTARAI